jgi:hypothetical protein
MISRRRSIKSVMTGLAACACALAGPAAAQLGNSTPGQVAVEAVELAVDSSTPGTDLAPSLRITGAWRLTSADRRFGGYSAILPTGDDLLLVSDNGHVLRLSGISRGMPSRGEFIALPESCIKGRKGGIGDAESIALTPDGTGLQIGIERSNAVCLFEPDDPDSGRLIKPEAMAGWKRNRGAESMATLPGEGTAIIGEGKLSRSGERPLLWFEGDLSRDEPPPHKLRYLPPRGFKPADAEFLPDGRLLMLDRRSGVLSKRRSKLSVVEEFDPEAEGPVSGTRLGIIGKGPLAANYEGMAVSARDEDGLVIWLIADGGSSSAGGTMLLRLEWREEPRLPVTVAGGGNQSATRARLSPE